jgi:type III secretion system YscD/HrpQ family protein
LKFIKTLDDSGVIIDEYVWREINQVLARNIAWKGITIHSQEAGKFVITGYLQTRKQDEQLWNYINSNFPYLDLLEKRIVVEEDLLTNVSSALQNKGFKDITAQMNNGELTLSGAIATAKEPALQSLIEEFRKIQGIRDIKNFVIETAPEQSMINVSDRYEVTGVSHQGSNLSVVINGRILTRGDILDGMTLISIKPNVIFLEKDGVKYRIDYSR